MFLLIAACGKSTEEKWQEQYDLGQQYLLDENYEEAIVAFTAAIEIDPNQTDAYIGRGDAYFALAQTENANNDDENYQSAMADYKMALKLNDLDIIKEKIKNVQKILREKLITYTKNKFSYKNFMPFWDDYDKDGVEELFVIGDDGVQTEEGSGMVAIYVCYCSSNKQICEEIDRFEISVENSFFFAGSSTTENISFLYYTFGPEENNYNEFYTYGVIDGKPEILLHDKVNSLNAEEVRQYIENELE